MNTFIEYSSSILNNLLSFLLVYKYYALFLITYISAVGFPLPSTSVVIASAAFSSQGYFDFWYVILTAQLGNVAGDNTAYALTRFFGRKVINKVGILRKIFDLKQVGQVEDILRNRPVVTIVFSRFMTQIGPVVDYLSGLINLNYKKYITLVVLGELLQVSLFSSIGYELGDQWQSALNVIAIISGLLALLVVLYILQKVFLNKSHKVDSSI